MHGSKIGFGLGLAFAAMAAALPAFASPDVRFVEEARPELGAVRRWAEISTGAEEDVLDGIDFTFAPEPVGPEGGWTMPAHWPLFARRRPQFEPGRTFDGSWGADPCTVIVEHGDGTWTMWLADVSRDYSDMAYAHVTERDGAVEVRIGFASKGYVRKGAPQKSGDVWVLRGTGGIEGAYAAIPRWYEAVGQRPPEGCDRAAMRARVVYSTGMKGPVEQHRRNGQGPGEYDGGFAAKREVIPAIAALGANTVWVRPVNGGYNPDDYYRIDPEAGTPDDFRDYVARAHSAGLALWHDAVAHGGSSHFQRFKDHPEWLTYRKDGKPTWTYWCADFNWPTWIDYMSKYVEDYTRDYALDGWRMDVPYGSRGDNWSRDIPYARASYASWQGGLNQQRGMRAGARRANPSAVTLAESLCNAHGATADAIYDIALCHRVLYDAPFADTATFVADLRTWLDQQNRAGFPGVVRMRYIESHDTLRALKMYGQQSRNILFALTAFLPGMPMIYEEGEDGSFENWRNVLAWRAANPALVHGDIEWIGDAPDGVLAFVRRKNGGGVAVALNFNADPVPFLGETLPPLSWRLFGATPPPRQEPFVFHPAQGELAVERSVEPDGRRIYRFRSGERWFVKAADGNYESPWIVRHPTFEKVEGFVYRTSIEGAVRFDSIAHPLGFGGDGGALVGAISGGEAAALSGIHPAARVKVLDRVGDDPVLAVSVEGPDGERVERMAADEIDLETVSTGDSRLRSDFCGWVFEDGGLKVRINRHGVLMGVWRDSRKLCGRVELCAEKGEGWRRKVVRQGWDADTELAFSRDADGGLRLRFTGQTRHSSRQEEARYQAPIDFVSTFSFAPDGSFVYETEFVPDPKRVVEAGTPFWIESEDAEGAVTRESFAEAGKIRREFAADTLSENTPTKE